MEGREVTQPAGFLVRILAYLLDGLLVGIPIAVIGVTLWGVSADARWFVEFVLFLYFFFLPVFWSGYTVGKRILRIRIIKVNGEIVWLDTMFLRLFVSGLIYVLTFGIAFIISIMMLIIREDKRMIHDFLSGTTVTFKKPN